MKTFLKSLFVIGVAIAAIGLTIAALPFVPGVVIPVVLIKAGFVALAAGSITAIGSAVGHQYHEEIDNDEQREQIVDAGQVDVERLEVRKAQQAPDPSLEKKAADECNEANNNMKKTLAEHENRLQKLEAELMGVIRSQGAKSTYEGRRQVRASLFKPENPQDDSVNVEQETAPNATLGSP